jgi:hypothetical protein
MNRSSTVPPRRIPHPAANPARAGQPTLRRLTELILLTLGLLLGSPSRADLLQTGFDVEYDVSWNGLSLGMTQRRLQPQSEGQFEFRSRTVAEGLVATFFSDVVEEASRLQIDGGHANPSYYRYRQVGGKKDRSYDLEFDWQRRQLRFSHNRSSAPLAPQTQDALSFFIEVMLRLRAGDARFAMTVAGRKKVRDYQVTTIGSETLSTALGTLPVIYLRAQEVGRDTRYELWCSAAHDFLPLKILQIKPDETIELTVRGLQVAG